MEGGLNASDKFCVGRSGSLSGRRKQWSVFCAPLLLAVLVGNIFWGGLSLLLGRSITPRPSRVHVEELKIESAMSPRTLLPNGRVHRRLSSPDPEPPKPKKPKSVGHGTGVDQEWKDAAANSRGRPKHLGHEGSPRHPGPADDPDHGPQGEGARSSPIPSFLHLVPCEDMSKLTFCFCLQRAAVARVSGW